MIYKKINIEWGLPNNTFAVNNLHLTNTTVKMKKLDQIGSFYLKNSRSF